MKIPYVVIICIIVVFLWQCNGLQQKTIPSYKVFEEFEPQLNQKNDTIYIINFWATWCTPCVKELPYFEKINTKYSNEKIRVILVSLDAPEHKESQLVPFIKKQNIQSEVALLEDIDINRWGSRVDNQWDGAIPFTIIYKAEKRKTYLGSFANYEELEKELLSFVIID